MSEVRPGGGIAERREPGIVQQPGIVSAVVFLVSLTLLGAGWTIKGGIDAAIRPDSDDFVLAGQAMLSWIATGGEGFEAMKAHAVFPHYFIPSVILAGCYAYFSEPVVNVVALNVVLFSLLVVLLYQFWISVHGTWSRWAGRRGFVISGLGGFYIIFGLPDPFLLSYTVLTDTIFLFWTAVFVVATARGILDGSRTSWTVAMLMAAAAPFVRPTGVLLPVLFLYVLVGQTLLKRGITSRTLVVASVGVPLVIALLIVPWLVSMKINGADWVDAVIPDLVQHEFDQAVHFFRNGVVVANRVDTYMDTPRRYMDILTMIMDRLYYYWVPLRFGDKPFDLTHNIVNLIYVLSAWPLMVLGIHRLAVADRHCRMVALFLVMVALSYALLHSVTLLSFGWRYQLPAMVPLWMLAGVGLFSVLGRPVRARRAVS